MIDCTWHILLSVVVFHCNYKNIIQFSHRPWLPDRSIWKQTLLWMSRHVCVCVWFDSSEEKLIFDNQGPVFLLQGASQVYVHYSYPSCNKIGLSEILTSSNWQLSIVPRTVIFIGKLEAHCWLSSSIKQCCLQKWNSVSNTFTLEAPDRR